MTAPLEPCPFCGGPVHVERGDGGVGTINCAKGSTCIGSGMLVGFRLTDEETAITAWNARADAPELLALIYAAKAVDHDTTHGNGLEGFRKNRERLRIALERWEALQ